MYKSIGGVETAIERGFGQIRAERHKGRAEDRAEVRTGIGLVEADIGLVKADIGLVKTEIGLVKAEKLEVETKIEVLESDLKRTKWQVRLLFGVVSCLFHSCMRYMDLIGIGYFVSRQRVSIL